MQAGRQLRIRLAIQSGIFIALFLALVTLLAYAALQYRKEWDITRSARNTLSQSTLDVLRWSNDGTTWTKGPLWGIAQKAEVLGVFYNKATFQKLGLKLPTTFDEFQATLASARMALHASRHGPIPWHGL